MNELMVTPNMVDIIFWSISIITICCSLLVVTIRDIFKAAVFLAGAFIGVACLFFLLKAEFVGIVQILVYVGAVSILIAFSVMMIRDVAQGSRPSRGRIASATVSALFLILILFCVYNTNWTTMASINDENIVAGLVGKYHLDENQGAGIIVAADENSESDVRTGIFADSTGPIGTLLVRNFVLPFEIVGLIIVAALIGGLALMRPEDMDREVKE